MRCSSLEPGTIELSELVTEAGSVDPRRDSVSAVVVTYLRPEGLAASISALRAQTHPPASIIVVDNGGDVSIDDFDDATGIVLLSPGNNTGAAGGFALGMHAAADSGHGWVYLINDDDRPRPGAIEQLLSLASTTGSRTMAMGWVTLSGRVVATGAQLHRGLQYPTCADASGEPYEVDVATFGGLLVPTAVIRDVGPPRADFFMMWEEYEFCLRARGAGWRITVLPEPLVDIDGLPPGSRSRPWRAYYEARNSLITLREHGHRSDRWWWLRRQLKYLAAALGAHDRSARVAMRGRGMIDGIRGRTGRTVEPW